MQYINIYIYIYIYIYIDIYICNKIQDSDSSYSFGKIEGIVVSILSLILNSICLIPHISHIQLRCNFLLTKNVFLNNFSMKPAAAFQA